MLVVVHLDSEFRQLRIVFPTRARPNQTVTLSSRLNEDQARLVRDFLISGMGTEVSENILNRFSKKQKKFLAVSDVSVYNGLDELLIKYAWGWGKGEIAKQ